MISPSSWLTHRRALPAQREQRPNSYGSHAPEPAKDHAPTLSDPVREALPLKDSPVSRSRQIPWNPLHRCAHSVQENNSRRGDETLPLRQTAAPAAPALHCNSLNRPSVLSPGIIFDPSFSFMLNYPLSFL